MFIDPYPAKLIYLNFQPLEVVSRHREPQPQVVENYSYLSYKKQTHKMGKICLLKINIKLNDYK